MIFSYLFRVPTNTESFYITAFILTLIVQPAVDKSGFMLLIWASLFAMASKFILVINRRHIFNPAAVAMVACVYLFGQGASWWVGNMYLQIVLILGGLLIVRKIRRGYMVATFIAVNLACVALYSYMHGTDVWFTVKSLFIYSQIFFFATVMFTEPATTPPTHKLRILYGAIVGFLASPFAAYGNFYFTPELALVAGNIYSFLVSPKFRLVMTFLEKRKIGEDIYEFVFAPNRKLNFRPGQYLEWTYDHSKPDLRGNRRYFTIASSPTEENVRLGVKFYPEASSFKKSLQEITSGQKLMAGQLAGDFTLPKNPKKKLIFIAGGIGITPYRSMLKYLLDKNEKRPITMFLSCKSEFEIVYREILSEADTKLGIKTIYTLTQDIPQDWGGERGRVSPEMIKKYVADFQDRSYYISGTHSMVTGTEKMLRAMGIPKKQIITDFFPGF
jgi:ferredoxin-NADP reductase